MELVSTRPARWNHNLHYHRVILAAVPDGARRSLDVGCGEGMLARDLRRLVAHVTGIDRDAASIDVARREDGGTGVEYVVGDFMTHPFEPGSSTTSLRSPRCTTWTQPRRFIGCASSWPRAARSRSSVWPARATPPTSRSRPPERSAIASSGCAGPTGRTRRRGCGRRPPRSARPAARPAAWPAACYPACATAAAAVALLAGVEEADVSSYPRGIWVLRGASEQRHRGEGGGGGRGACYSACVGGSRPAGRGVLRGSRAFCNTLGGRPEGVCAFDRDYLGRSRPPPRELQKTVAKHPRFAHRDTCG